MSASIAASRFFAASSYARMCIVSVFPLKVLIQLGTWPEAAERDRRWMSVKDAASAVMEPDLADLIRAFGAGGAETLP